MSMRASGGGAVAEVAYGLLGSRSWFCAIPVREAQRIASVIAARVAPVRTAPFSACSGAGCKRAESSPTIRDQIPPVNFQVVVFLITWIPMKRALQWSVLDAVRNVERAQASQRKAVSLCPIRVGNSCN